MIWYFFKSKSLILMLQSLSMIITILQLIPMTFFSPSCELSFFI